MEVILLQNIQNLGQIGDTVKVKPGFGRNYLLPYGKALPATEENRKEFEQRRAELEAASAERRAAAKARHEQLHEQAVTIPARASSEGKLYGSVGPREIGDAFTAAGQPVDKSEVDMPEGPIREVGSFPVSIQLYPEIEASVTVEVVAES